MKSFLVLLFLTSTVNCFMPQLPKLFSDKKHQTFEPFYDDEEIKTVIFHTAAFNKLPSYVYSDLINKMNDDNLKVIIPSENCKKLIKKLDDGLTVLGHSSGSITALENCKNEKVKNLVLIDPIDNRFINKDEDDDEDENSVIDLQNIELALILYTKKSYDWSLFPFSLPFVPDSLSLKPNKINIKDNDNKIVLEVNKFGHCDILDKRWANLAHNLISKGTEKREDLSKYHKWLSFLTKSAAFDNVNDIIDTSDKFKNFKLKTKQKKIIDPDIDQTI